MQVPYLRGRVMWASRRFGRTEGQSSPSRQARGVGRPAPEGSYLWHVSGDERHFGYRQESGR